MGGTAGTCCVQCQQLTGTLAELLPAGERLDGFIEPGALMIDLLVDDAGAIGRSSGQARDVPLPLTEEAIEQIGIREQVPQLRLSGLSPVQVCVDLRRHPDGRFPVRPIVHGLTRLCKSSAAAAGHGSAAVPRSPIILREG